MYVNELFAWSFPFSFSSLFFLLPELSLERIDVALAARLSPLIRSLVRLPRSSRRFL